MRNIGIECKGNRHLVASALAVGNLDDKLTGRVTAWQFALVNGHLSAMQERMSEQTMKAALEYKRKEVAVVAE